MFAFGVGVISLTFIIGIKWGSPGIGFNWADHVALWGCAAGIVLCNASISLWLWRVLP
jgi:hypothetical protein